MQVMNLEDTNELEQVKELVRAGNIGEAKPRLYALAAKYSEDTTIKQMVTYINNPQPTQQVSYQPPQQPYYAPPPQPYYPAHQSPPEQAKKGLPIWAIILCVIVGLIVFGSIINAATGGSASTKSASKSNTSADATVAVRSTEMVLDMTAAANPASVAKPVNTEQSKVLAPTATPNVEATQTAAAMATEVAATAVAVKEEQAAATAAAKPTATPVPPTPVPAKGTGLTLAGVKTSLQRKGSFTFEDSPLNDGRSRQIAKSRNSIAFVEMIGPASNLSEVNIVFGVDKDELKTTLTVSDLLAYMNAVAPTWENGPSWINASFTAMGKGQEITNNTYSNLAFEMRIYRELGAFFILTTKAR